MKTLEFRIKEIHEERMSSHELLVSPAEIGLEIEDVRVVGHLYGRLQLLRRVGEVYVKSNFSALIEAPCRRCAEPFETHIEADIEVQFCPTDESNPIDPLLIDAGVRYYSGECIDLSEDVRQAITLEIPVWPLCAESCKGLCHHCGENLNIATCNCDALETVSKPFAVLADLFNHPNRSVGSGSK